MTLIQLPEGPTPKCYRMTLRKNILVCSKMNVQMTRCFEIYKARHPFDVHCFLLLRRNSRFPSIYFSELFSFNFDSQSKYYETCFSSSRILQFCFTNLKRTSPQGSPNLSTVHCWASSWTVQFVTPEGGRAWGLVNCNHLPHFQEGWQGVGKQLSTC